jgi:hypothetical protein
LPFLSANIFKDLRAMVKVEEIVVVWINIKQSLFIFSSFRYLNETRLGEKSWNMTISRFGRFRFKWSVTDIF